MNSLEKRAAVPLLNVERERAMLRALERLEDVIRKETEYSVLAAALRRLEREDIPEAADARARAEALEVVAQARSGELTKRLPKAKPGRRGIVSEGPDIKKQTELDDLGLSRQRASEREELHEAQEAEPEAFEQALKSKEPKRAVDRIVRQRKKRKRHRERTDKLRKISRGNKRLALPQTYPVILADPPWRYEHVKTESRAIENQYPTMELADICRLPVASLATPDAVLFLWATSPKLAESLEVIVAWGFTYRTCAVWVKDKIGMGYYFRQQHELLLVATRGTPPVPPESKRVASIFKARRARHSAKPESVYVAIERMYARLPKVEIFCRKPRKGWAAWGNEA